MSKPKSELSILFDNDSKELYVNSDGAFVVMGFHGENEYLIAEVQLSEVDVENLILTLQGER